MHTKNMILKSREKAVLESYFIDYRNLIGERSSASQRSGNILTQVSLGDFESVQNLISDPACNLNNNPIYLHTLLIATILTPDVTNAKKLQFIEFLTKFKPLLELIKRFPYKVYEPGIKQPEYFIHYDSALNTAASIINHEILQFLMSIDSGLIIRSDALDIAASRADIDGVKLILREYTIFTEKELNTIISVQKIIDGVKAAHIKMKAIKAILEKHNLQVDLQSNCTLDKPKNLDNETQEFKHNINLSVNHRNRIIDDAAANNMLETIRMYINLDNGQTVADSKALFMAVACEHLEMVKLLTDNPNVVAKAKPELFIKFTDPDNKRMEFINNLEEVLGILNAKRVALQKPVQKLECRTF